MPRESWILPDNRKHYHEVCFLTAHNAFASKAEGWHWCRQQNLSVADQLALGVRGFMLDTYVHKGSVVLCHGGTHAVLAFQRSIGEGMRALRGHAPAYQTLGKTLIVLRDWLIDHPHEIVTLFLENYVPNDRLSTEIQAIPELSPLIFKKKHKSAWPTIAWMQEHNKRLVIFNENKSGTPISDAHPFMYLWDEIIESGYATLRKQCIARERAESYAHQEKSRSLYLMNHFPFLAMTARASKRYNAYHTVRNTVEFCRMKGLAQGKNPNFIALDFVDQGSALRLVNELNSESHMNHKKESS